MLDPGQGLCLAGAPSRSFVARVGTKDAARRVTLAARASLSPRELPPPLAVKTSLHAARDNSRARIRSPCDLSPPSESISSGF